VFTLRLSQEIDLDNPEFVTQKIDSYEQFVFGGVH